MSTPASTRQQRRREATADRIVEAAGALFGERGVQATKVADICARADVAHQTFFNHFPTKQDVVHELVRRGHDFLIEAIDGVLAEDADTGTRLARLFEAIHTSAAAVGPMHQDLVSETLRAGHEEKDLGDTRRLHRALEGLIRAGRARGDVTRKHAAEDLVALVIGALSQLMLDWAHRPGFDIEQRSRRLARLLADALAPR
ncbi:MAG: TetR/AcrR family transcriptional regulator [Myxococcota bacterium]